MSGLHSLVIFVTARGIVVAQVQDVEDQGRGGNGLYWFGD